MNRLLLQFVFLHFVLFAAAQARLQRNTSNGNGVVDAREVQDFSKDDKNLVDQTNTADQQFRRLPSLVGGNANSILLSHYPVAALALKTSFKDTILLSQVNEIKIIDARFDNTKVGFLPVAYVLQKKGYTTLGLQIGKTPVDWLTQHFINKNVITDTNSRRQLVLVIQKLWFSNSAADIYTVANPRLLTTLHYHFDVYTALNFGYYPQKQVSGTFTTLYDNGNAYNALADSLLLLLEKDAFTNMYASSETESKWLAPVDFNDHYNKRLQKLAHPEKMAKGVYMSYADFVDQRIMTDSAEMIVKYNNYDHSPVFACQLAGYREGKPLSCSKAWGYYDGSSLFLNTGNGFYIRLLRSKEDFVFYYLANLHEEKLKPDLQSSIHISDSHYDILKNYTKAFRLTYQLDYDTGKLY